MALDSRPMGSPPAPPGVVFYSRVPTRNPEWKLHKRKSDATNAVKVTRCCSEWPPAEAWAMIDGVWRVILNNDYRCPEIDPQYGYHTRNCTRCGGSKDIFAEMHDAGA